MKLFGRSFKKRFVLGAGATTLFLVAAFCQSGPAPVVFDSFDTGQGGWSASKGSSVSSSTDEKHEGSGALAWRLEYRKDALFISTKNNLDRFAGADGVSFWLKSDRKAPLFLRLDNGFFSPFIVPFEVDESWKEYTFRFEDLQGVGKNKRIDSKKISAFYLVDLGGKDNGLKGNRTIWVDSINVVGSPSASAGGSANPATGAGSDLVVRAYDENGKLMSASEMKDRGVSAGEAFFVSDLQGTSVPYKAASARVEGKSVTALAPDSGRAVALNFLFWTVPGYGKVWLRADNGGKGYKDGASINANYELARSRVLKLEDDLKRSGLNDNAASSASANARELLSRAERESDEVRKAAASDRALSAALQASDALQLAVARRDIERYRKGSISLTVVDSNGRPVANAPVSFQQKRSSVLFGCIQSFGFIDQKPGTDRLDAVAALMQDAGFNHFTISLFWDRIEPRRGQMDLDDWDRKLGLDSFFKRGFTFTAHAMVQSALPEHVKRDGASKFADNASRHVEDVMRHYMQKYPGAVKIWQAINEPSSNRYVGLDMNAKLDAIQRISETIHRVDPSGKVLVNDYDWDRGQRHKANFLQPDLKDMISTAEYFQKLNERRVPYDIMGLQWYPGLRVIYGGGIINLSEPLLDLAATGSLWDRYGAMGKPLHITEMAVPGTTQGGWNNGYWHQPWNPEIQAEYMANVYTVAFSKPYIHEITYWGVTDHEPWAIKGGLLNDRYEPKPIYTTLKKLLSSWRTEGTGRTDGSGRLTVNGFGGDYELQVAAAGSRRLQFRIEEGKNTSARVSY